MPEKITPAEIAAKMRNSDDMPRLRAPGNPWSGLTLEEAQEHKMGLLFSSDSGRQKKLDELNAAINDSKFGRDDVDAYFDLLDKRLVDKGGLDPTLKVARDTALGLIEGSLVSEYDDSNLLLGDINAEFTSVTDNGGAIIPTIWDSGLWVEMNATAENFIPTLRQIPMLSNTTRLPILSSDLWDRATDRADARFHWVELTARDLGRMWSIPRNQLDGSESAAVMDLRHQIPNMMTDALHEEIILGDAKNAGLLNYARKDTSEGAQVDLGAVLSSSNMDNAIDDLRNALGWGGFQPGDFMICHRTERERIKRVSDAEIYAPRTFPPGFQANGDISDRAIWDKTGAVLAVSRPLARFGVRLLPSVRVFFRGGIICLHVRMQFAFALMGYDPYTGRFMSKVPGERVVAILHNIMRTPSSKNG